MPWQVTGTDMLFVNLNPLIYKKLLEGGNLQSSKNYLMVLSQREVGTTGFCAIEKAT